MILFEMSVEADNLVKLLTAAVAFVGFLSRVYCRVLPQLARESKVSAAVGTRVNQFIPVPLFVNSCVVMRFEDLPAILAIIIARNATSFEETKIRLGLT